ncbi:MAG: hypothetical protein WCV91_03025 [Candidatus Margulisiibacteriota bacterium]
MAKKKEVSMDVVLKRLDEHDQRFDRLEKKLGDHDRRFDKIDAKFDKIDAKFDKIDAKFDEVLTGIDKIVGEMEKSREDRIFSVAKDREQDGKIENLDKRGRELETSKA